MDVTRIEVRHLRQLVGIADRGDLAAAARALRVPVTRLVRRLRHLEALAGGPLFERGRSALVPTARGEEVLGTARAVLAALAALVDEAEGWSAPLRLAAVDGLLTPAAAALARSQPGRRVVSRTAASATAVDAVRTGDADLAVAVRWPHVPWSRFPGCAETRIARPPLRLLVPRSHRLAGRVDVDLADLAGEAWCVRGDADAAAAVEAECQRAGLEPDVRYRTSGDAELRDVVAAGLAVALTAHPEQATHGLSTVGYHGARTAEWAVVRGAVTDPAAAAVVVDALEALTAGPALPDEGAAGPDTPLGEVVIEALRRRVARPLPTGIAG